MIGEGPAFSVVERRNFGDEGPRRGIHDAGIGIEQDIHGGGFRGGGAGGGQRRCDATAQTGRHVAH